MVLASGASTTKWTTQAPLAGPFTRRSPLSNATEIPARTSADSAARQARMTKSLRSEPRTHAPELSGGRKVSAQRVPTPETRSSERPASRSLKRMRMSPQARTSPSFPVEMETFPPRCDPLSAAPGAGQQQSARRAAERAAARIMGSPSLSIESRLPTQDFEHVIRRVLVAHDRQLRDRFGLQPRILLGPRDRDERFPVVLQKEGLEDGLLQLDIPIRLVHREQSRGGAVAVHEAQFVDRRAAEGR